MPIVAPNRWISIFKPQGSARLRLFCFPYAGGSAAAFRSWPNELPADVEVCAIQIPGRGARLAEPPFNRMPALVSALGDALLPMLDKPFAFFGHSMGAWVAFEVARLFQRARGPQPLHLFASGARAPQMPSREIPIHDLPEREFVRALGRLNGTPQEVLEHEELMQLMLPILRADFEVCETYSYKQGSVLNCPITAFAGLDDRKLNRSEVKGWESQTRSRFASHLLPGDHFFLNTAQPLLLSLIGKELTRLTATVS